MNKDHVYVRKIDTSQYPWITKWVECKHCKQRPHGEGSKYCPKR